jgi:mRNA-degrading endonuclease toxin of MazEF toxin-antitoxin module
VRGEPAQCGDGAKDGLGRRVSRLGPDRMRQVCAALAFALECSH